MEEGQDPAHLLLLPEEVFYGYIFPKVGLSDLVRLRRVCKPLKIFGDAYLRVHHVTQEREINEGDHSFAEFLRRDLPSSSIYLNNLDTSNFEQPEVPVFLEKYGDLITHLRVNHFATCVSPAEDNFYGALKNLQHLELHYIDARDWEMAFKMLQGPCVPHEPTYIPPTFKNLKTLKLHDLKVREINDWGYYYELVNFCVNLEHLKHPRFLGEYTSWEPSDGPFMVVKKEIDQRLRKDPNYQTPLRVFDLEHHDKQGFFMEGFMSLANLAQRQDFQLWNVDRWLIGGRQRRSELDCLAKTVLSVRNLPCGLFMQEMPLLEKIQVTSLSQVAYPSDFFRGQQAPRWPSLREVELNIDGEETGGAYTGDVPVFVDPEDALDFILFLFEWMERPKLTTLKLYFDREGTCDPGTALPLPRAEWIGMTCGNLKVLHLYNWQGTNKALSELWAKLELLEEVTLEKCTKMGNVAFVGKDREDPTFLKLTNLRKFSLFGLDQLPKITDTIFHLVFKHLKIKEFRIASDKPISSVTIKGIRALTEGPFQNSVEKFPFTGWSLENVDTEEWTKLKTEFRATFML